MRDTKDENDKKYFASRVVWLIEDKLVAERGVKLLRWQNKQLEDLKKIACSQ